MEPTSNFPDFGFPEGIPDPSIPAVPDRGSDVSHETKTRIRQSINRRQVASATAIDAEIKALRSFTLTRLHQTQSFAVINPQARSGKTSFTVNLAATLARQGLKVLVLDLAQRASEFLGGAGEGMSEVLRGTKTIADAVKLVAGYSSLYYVAADATLDTTEFEMSYSIAKETRLHRALRDFLAGESGWDYVLIDAPSNLGLLTLNALHAADGIFTLLPVSQNAASYLASLEGFIDFAAKNLEHNLSSFCAIEIETEKMDDDTATYAPAPSERWQVLEAGISWSRDVQEAEHYRQLVIDDHPISGVTLDYLKCAREINKLFV